MGNGKKEGKGERTGEVEWQGTEKRKGKGKGKEKGKGKGEREREGKGKERARWKEESLRKVGRMDGRTEG